MAENSAQLFVARIKPTSDRHAWWVQALGTDIVPIQAPASEGSRGSKGMFHSVDLGRLSGDQQEQLCQALAELWSLPIEDVRRDVKDRLHGVLIVADDVVVSAADAAVDTTTEVP